MKDGLYFDEESELMQNEIPQSNSCVIKISFSLDFDIGQSYVTSKIEDRDGNIRKLNIQPGIRGIKLQRTLSESKTRSKATLSCLCPNHTKRRENIGEKITYYRNKRLAINI